MRRHTNEDIIVPLPEGISACDIGNLTIWCRQANVIFGKIPIPTTTFVSVILILWKNKTLYLASNVCETKILCTYVFIQYRLITELHHVQSL